MKQNGNRARARKRKAGPRGDDVTVRHADGRVEIVRASKFRKPKWERKRPAKPESRPAEPARSGDNAAFGREIMQRVLPAGHAELQRVAAAEAQK